MLHGVCCWKLRSWDDYVSFAPKMAEEFGGIRAREQALAVEKHGQSVRGYSATAGSMVDFAVHWPAEGGAEPNWRETLICPISHMNNRVRASADFLFAYGATPESRIYATEQNTHFFNWLRTRFDHVVGSEYLDDVAPGTVNARDFRCEDLTRLTFGDANFDYVLSFDVLEHIPDFISALKECSRVLAPGGKLLLTAPFGIPEEKNVIRAIVRHDGAIEHLLPPEYHGDPVRPEGVLCYQSFGWELLDQMRACGFADAHAVLYWSDHSAYLGGFQILIVGEK